MASSDVGPNPDQSGRDLSQVSECACAIYWECGTRLYVMYKQRRFAFIHYVYLNNETRLTISMIKTLACALLLFDQYEVDAPPAPYC